MRKLLLVIFSISFIYNSLFAQTNLRTNGSQLISMKFFYPKIESAANQSFFNILTLKNNSGKQFSGKIKYTLPAGWNIIGDRVVDISVLPYDSINIPIRVVVSSKVVGEIAYAVVAGLFNSSNRPIKTEYCFINIPRISDLIIKAPNNIIYFDNKNKTAKFKYRVSNHGNTNEIVQLMLNGNENLAVENNVLSDGYAMEYNIAAHTDTVIDISIKLEEKDQNKDFYQVLATTFTQDSLYKNRLWFNKINSKYNHIIPEDNKCAIIELTAGNILSRQEPIYSLMVKGSILLKHNTDIYYFFRKNDLTSNWDDYYSTRVYIGVNTKNIKVKIGSIQSNFNEIAYGLGSILKIDYKKISAKSFYSYNDIILQQFYGGELNYQATRKTKVSFGYAENSIERYRNYSKILYTGVSFPFLKKNSLSVKAYLNNTTRSFSTPFDKQGIAILANYTGNFNNFNANIWVEYGSPEYSGISRGKFTINSALYYIMKNKNILNLIYSKNDVINSYYINDIQQPIRKTYNSNYEFIYSIFLDEKTAFDIGSMYKTAGFNFPYVTTNPNMFFKTINPRISFAVRFNNPSTKFYIKPKIDFGNIIVTEAENLANSNRSSYLTYNINLYSSYKSFSLYTIYRNGPNGLYGQFYYYDQNFYTNWMYIMPTFNQDLFNDKLNLDLRFNYRYDITLQDKSYAISTQLIYYMPKSWSFRILNSVTAQAKQDRVNGSTQRFNSVYFEAAIRKEFNCKQPRFQYHNLNIIFFKDLNGNRKKESNEPGLRNVLAAIEPDYEIEDSKENKDFISQKLLTGTNGNINYTNIVNGSYNLKYVLIGDMVGNFNREELSQQFVVDEDKTIYIPYLENNRIVGKVILNRDPLSSYGNIDISNIRVIAEDTQGHSYSALTDKQGHFTLYTPVTDHYVVKINNIFYENFDIQQPEFVVKFNGYKQFEVTFVFDEKKKQINFDNELSVDDLKLDDIKVIRKTTLTGKIRDAISLEPVGAEIKIINNKTNKVVSRAISNKENGNYSISYAAGTHFRVEVLAKGYWEHVENLYIEQVISIQNINKDIMLNKEGADREEEQKTFIIYNKKEEDFTENFKQGQQIPINYLNFNLKETRLDPKAKPELDRLIDLLNKNKTVSIEIAGYADDGGNARVEKMMAKRRADAVAKYLIDHGLAEDRITVISYGNTRPLVPGSSEKAKAKNRRVEIIVR